MYKSFTSKAIFPWSGRWRRAVRQRWTGWKTAILLSILVSCLLRLPFNFNPSRRPVGESDACVQFLSQKEMSRYIWDGCTAPMSTASVQNQSVRLRKSRCCGNKAQVCFICPPPMSTFLPSVIATKVSHVSSVLYLVWKKIKLANSQKKSS